MIRIFACSAVVLFSLVACGRTTLPCNADTCPTGCCDLNNDCRVGNTTDACGKGGLLCRACISCFNNACATGGGGFSTSGGGSASGGGNANGGGSPAGGGIGTGGGSAAGGGTETLIDAARFEPALVFVVDRSGSTNLPIDPMAMGCPPGCGIGLMCPPGCPTRWRAIVTAVQSLSTSLEQKAVQGAIGFPGGGSNQCGTATVVNGLPANGSTDLVSAATITRTLVSALVPGGGTPTNSAIQLLGMQPRVPVNDARFPGAVRETVGVLITDGAPNCNPNVPVNNCSGPPVCTCTLNGVCSGQYCALGCLDQETSTSANQLNIAGVRTMLIGIGPEVRGNVAFPELSLVASRGGLPRLCPGGSASECGMGNTCNSGICTGFHTLNGTTESQATTARLTRVIDEAGRCRYLVQGGTTAFSRVTFAGAPLQAGTDFDLEADGKHVKFKGSTCDQLISSATEPRFLQ